MCVWMASHEIKIGMKEKKKKYLKNKKIEQWTLIRAHNNLFYDSFNNKNTKFH